MALPPELSKMLEESLEENSRRKKFEKNQSKKVDERKIALKILAEYRKEQEHKESLSKIRRLRSQEAYSRSRSGRFTSKLRRVGRFIQSPSKSLYNKTRPIHRSLQRTRLPPRPLNNQQIQAMQKRKIEQENYNRIFSNFTMQDPRNNIPMQVEQEIVSPRGYGNEGDAEASRVGAESVSVGFNMTALPLAVTTQQADLFSNFQHIKSINDVSREVDFFSNILNQKARKR